MRFLLLAEDHGSTMQGMRDNENDFLFCSATFPERSPVYVLQLVVKETWQQMRAEHKRGRHPKTGKSERGRKLGEK